MACLHAPVSSALNRSRLDVLLAAHPADSEEFLQEIRQSGFELKDRLVQDIRHLGAALEKTSPDVLVISSRVAGFSAAAAANLMQSIQAMVPVVMVLERDESAETNLLLDVLREGASSALFRDQLYALRDAVYRAVRIDGSERREAGERMLAIQAGQAADFAAKNRQLEMRTREAERANRLKSELMAGVGHELRSPLQTIMGFTELLSMEIKGALNEEQRQYLSYIQRDSQHLLSLLNEVLDLGNIDAGRLELRLETIEAERFIVERLAAMRPLAEAKSVSLESNLAPDLLLRADRVRLGEILHKLVGGAVRSTPERSHVWVESRKLGGCARISVRDTGSGIAASSLGMAVTRRLVELHGGTIWIEGDTGPGSQLHFTIPLAAGPETDPVGLSPERLQSPQS